MKKLLIVESPNKIKTISKYLGDQWQVIASVGHIRDLPKKEIGIDINNNYLPNYQPYQDKQHVIKRLKEAVSSTNDIYLATDQDREGEAIAFHICELTNLDISNTKRVTFNELSKKAILTAIEKPRTIDMNLVDAQQSRRVIDRLVGYKLSPQLTYSLSSDNYLSAGRVQSAALRMIVDTENEINLFNPELSYKIKAVFKTNKEETFSAFYQDSLQNENQTSEYLHKFINDRFKVSNITEKERKKQPYPPFTTSTLQQQANKLLKFNLSTTTKVAQSLYEKGFITYIRTDSIAISDDAKSMIENYIIDQFGNDQYTERKYKNNISGAQEAHEAIRPTSFENNSSELSDQESSLYELIKNRTLASFLPDQISKVITLEINNNDNDLFLSKITTIQSPGWSILYKDNTDDEETPDNETLINQLPSINEALNSIEFSAKTSYTKPVERFTEATIVKQLEKKGIGRPSTFSSIINILYKRNYIINGNHQGKSYPVINFKIDQTRSITKQKSNLKLGSCKNKLLPTELGNDVIKYLKNKFNQIIDYEFTNNCEQSFDDIALGKNSYFNVVNNFYIPFSKLLESLPDTSQNKHSNRVFIGKYNEQELYAGKGKYGTYIHYNDKFYNVKDNKDPKKISLEDAIIIIEQASKPSGNNLGQHKNKDVITGNGKYGTYIKYNNKFYGVKDKEPNDISLDFAITVIENGSSNPNLIKKVGIYFIMKGQYGPYIRNGKSFIPIKNCEDPSTLNEDQIKRIINDYKIYKKSKK